MSKLADFAAEKDAEQFRTAFLEKISDKVVDCLETEKALVAQSFFSSETEDSIQETTVFAEGVIGDERPDETKNQTDRITKAYRNKHLPSAAKKASSTTAEVKM